MKLSLFNKSIEELEMRLLNDLKDRDLNDRIVLFSIKLVIKEHLKKTKIFLSYEEEENKILLYYRSKAWSDEEDVFLGEIVFDGIQCEEEFLISSVKINMYDSKDIVGFEKIRLRLLFD